ncbi:MAG TPA: hypothetical protein VHG33_06045 [Woeseiaceae bacterium]|nr:hypothetical protein [Woeseiaceae bacterium]
MLMTDKQVALSDVIVALREAADQYAHAAEALDDGSSLTERFAERGRRCNEAATALEPHIRRLGELPRQPDPEREALQNFLTRIAGIGTDERSLFLEALREREAAIEQTAADALRQPFAEDTLGELERVRTQARDEAAALAQLGGAQ